MIYDTLDHLPLYAALSPAFAEAVEAFVALQKRGALESILLGRIDFSDRIYVNIQEYDAKEKAECRFETHNNYMDIQIVTKGAEEFCTAELAKLCVVESYNPQTDCCYYTGKEQANVTLLPGFFVAVFANEPHMPGIKVGGSSQVRKIVIKVRT